MHFFHVLTKMNYRHMQNALEGINMYIKKPVMYYPKQVRRFSFIQTHSNDSTQATRITLHTDTSMRN